MFLSVEYSQLIENKILSHLDGWVISTPPTPPTPPNTTETTETTTTENVSSDPFPTVEPFITTLSNYQDAPNKRIKSSEVELFYNEALRKAYTLTNRWNVDDLTTIEEAIFTDAVCMLTASDLWNKFNIRVNNEDMEDTYVQSYGGLLYKQAINTLKPFINQRIQTITKFRQEGKLDPTIDDDCWW